MRDRGRTAWHWLGARSAFGVVLVWWIALVFHAWATDGGTGEVVGFVVILSGLGMHLWARPDGRWDVLGLAWWPGPVWALADEIANPPRLLGWVLVVLALLLAWGFDHDDDEQPARPREPASQ